MELTEFQKLVREKARTLREVLQNAARDVDTAKGLLNSMKPALDGLEAGTIKPPHRISDWGVYVGDHYDIHSVHPEVTSAFGELELILEFSDLNSYLKQRAYLEQMALPHRRSKGT